MDYPVVLERDDNGTILVSFPDFPEIHTFGEDEQDALTHAIDALATGIDAYVKERRDIPLPSAVVTRYRATLPTLSEAKIRLYEAMRRNHVSKSELCRRLHWHPPQVDRLLDLKHESRLSQLEAAFAVLGKRLVIGLGDVSTVRPSTRSRHVRSSARSRSTGRIVRATATDRRTR